MSSTAVPPTVHTEGSEAGDTAEASRFSLPAATPTKTPASTRLRAALLMALEKPPPRLMLASTPLGQLRVLESVTTSSMPLMMAELSP